MVKHNQGKNQDHTNLTHWTHQSNVKSMCSCTGIQINNSLLSQGERGGKLTTCSTTQVLCFVLFCFEGNRKQWQCKESKFPSVPKQDQINKSSGLNCDQEKLNKKKSYLITFVGIFLSQSRLTFKTEHNPKSRTE